jgi:hypothetical protein
MWVPTTQRHAAPRTGPSTQPCVQGDDVTCGQAHYVLSIESSWWARVEGLADGRQAVGFSTRE